MAMYFRYNGTFSFEDFYRQTRKFFTDRHMEFSEGKHKSKPDEIEGKFLATLKVDMYTEFEFDIEYKVIDVKQITVEKDGKNVQMISGKIWLELGTKTNLNYKDGSFSESKPLFDKNNKKQSLFMKIYEKVTFRDRDEGTEGEIIIIAHQYIDMLKGICNMETRY